MQRPPSLLAAVSFGAALAAACFAGCGTKGAGSGFTPPPNPISVSSSEDGSAGDASPAPTFGDDCKLPGLWCYQTAAPCSTTLSGTVYDPAGKVPLSGVVVYVPADPSIPLEPITTGTKSCSACTTQIANYMALAVTDVSGKFTMTGVPATTSVPVVVTVGKWRREVTLAKVTACRDNALPAATLRLPQSQKEGDMPELALLTGGCDDMACFLLNMGISANEFGAPHSGGRVDVYQGNSMPLGVGGAGPGLSNGTPGNCTNTSCPLWASKASFEYYDMAILSCQCSEMTTVSESPAAYTNLHDWLDEGGKVFASHYHYTWFKNNPDPAWVATATWLGSSIAAGSGTDDIDTTFTKGATFGQWLGNVGGLAGNGPPPTIALSSVASSVSTVNTATTERWIYDPSTSPNDTKYLSFLTPIGGKPATTPPPSDAGAEEGGGGEGGSSGAGEGTTYCGKAVFTDLHTSSGLFATAMNVPGDCKVADLTAQQKALEYLFFDLAACVAPKDAPPPTPPPNPPPPPPPPM
jgi:hypothetical protein